MTLVELDPTRCPACDTDLVATVFSEDALFRAAGYGATTETVVLTCPWCWWEITRSRGAVAPGRTR